MKLILTEDVPNLGSLGDTIEVKAGYGRNYLLPQGKALLATGKASKELRHRLQYLEKLRERVGVVILFLLCNAQSMNADKRNVSFCFEAVCFVVRPLYVHMYRRLHGPAQHSGSQSECVPERMA